MPTRVDFYVLSDTNDQGDGPLLMLCRLAEKAYNAGFQVWCRVQDGAAANHLDRLLWTFRDISFVPHGLLGTGGSSLVTIGSDANFWREDAVVRSKPQVVVNLCDTAVPDGERFDRICEVVGIGEAAKAAGRARYKAYQASGDGGGDRTFELNTVKV